MAVFNQQGFAGDVDNIGPVREISKFAAAVKFYTVKPKADSGTHVTVVVGSDVGEERFVADAVVVVPALYDYDDDDLLLFLSSLLLLK